MPENMQANRQRLFNRYFVLVWFAALALSLGQSMMNSTVTLYMDHLGYPEKLSGLVGLPYALLAMLARILGGSLCDRRGRRLTLVCAYVVFALSVWFFGCSTGIFALMLFRGIHGAGFSVAQTASNTVMVDVTPSRHRQMGIGIFYVATAAAFGAGSAIVVGLSAKGDYSPVFLFCTLMLGAGALFSLLCNYEKKPGFRPAAVPTEPVEQARGFRRYFEPKALPAGFVMFFMSLGGISLSSYALLYAEKMHFYGASLFFLITAVVMFLFNLGQAWLVRRLGAKLVLFFTFFLFGLSVLLLALTGSNVFYFIAGFGFGILQGICWPVGISLAVEGIPYERRGAANSTACLMTDIGAGAGTVAFGSLATGLGYSLSFVLLAGAMFCAALLSLILFRRKREGNHAA